MLIATIRWQLCQTVIETFLSGNFLIAKFSELLQHSHRFSIYVLTQRKQQPNMLGGNSFDQKVGISVQTFNLHVHSVSRTIHLDQIRRLGVNHCQGKSRA